MHRSSRFPPLLRKVLFVALAPVLVGGPLALSPSGQEAEAATNRSTNLLVGDTATLVRTGTWSGNSNVSSLTAASRTGVRSLRVTSKTRQTAEVQTGKSAVRARPGSVYTGQFFVGGRELPDTVQAVLSFFDAGGQRIAGPVEGPLMPVGTRGWGHVIAVAIAPPRAAFVTLGASFPGVLKNQTHDIAKPVLTATAGGSSAVVGPLRTVGNKIVDVSGEVVVLRGVNRSGTYNSTSPDRLSRYDFEQIKAWGANSVRITISQSVYLPGCPAYDSATARKIDSAVAWANDLGMVAILDLQWSAPTCGTSGLNPMPDPRSKVLWETLASRYADHPLVAFDLFNEPHGVSDQVWAHGGTATTASGVDYTAIGMKELYDTVRRTGAQNLVFIGGLDHASRWPATAPLTGTSNVVYAVHAYNCDSPNSCTHGTGSGWLLDRFVEPGKTHPIMVTEFGWPTSDAREAVQFNNGVIAFAERQGWGWMPWSWQVNGNCRTGAWWSLIADATCDVGDTYQPTAAGLPVLVGLLNNH